MFAVGKSAKKAITVVVFVGGCTYAEVSAIRELSKGDGKKMPCYYHCPMYLQYISRRDYVILTTSMLNSASFLGTLKSHIVDCGEI